MAVISLQVQQLFQSMIFNRLMAVRHELGILDISYMCHPVRHVRNGSEWLALEGECSLGLLQLYTEVL